MSTSVTLRPLHRLVGAVALLSLVVLAFGGVAAAATQQRSDAAGETLSERSTDASLAGTTRASAGRTQLERARDLDAWPSPAVLGVFVIGLVTAVSITSGGPRPATAPTRFGSTHATRAPPRPHRF